MNKTTNIVGTTCFCATTVIMNRSWTPDGRGEPPHPVDGRLGICFSAVPGQGGRQRCATPNWFSRQALRHGSHPLRAVASRVLRTAGESGNRVGG